MFFAKAAPRSRFPLVRSNGPLRPSSIFCNQGVNGQSTLRILGLRWVRTFPIGCRQLEMQEFVTCGDVDELVNEVCLRCESR